MKKTTLGMIICSIIGGVLILSGIIAGFFQGFKGITDPFSAWDGATVTANQTYVANGDVDRIIIDADAGAINVKTADVEKITVQYAKTSVISASVSEKGGALTIKQNVRSHLINNSGGEITVSIPSTLTTLSANVSLDAGVVKIKNTVFKSAEIEVDAGQILVDNGTIARLFVEMSAGDVNLEEVKTDQAEISVDVGDVNFSVVGNAEEYTLKSEIDLGSANFSDQTGNNPSKRIEISVDIGEANLSFTIA